MLFPAGTEHLTIRSFFVIAVGDVPDTTFGHDNSQLDIERATRRKINRKVEQRVKYNRVRTRRPPPICCERRWKSQARWRPARPRGVILPCPGAGGRSGLG